MSTATKPSFDRVAEEHLDDVYAYLLYLTGNRAVAEDLTADTFERALRHWRRYDPRRGAPKTWLCQIARSAAVDHFRSEQRRRRREERYGLLDRDEAVDDVLVDELPPVLEGALRQLSAAEREVVALRVLLDLDGETTARLLGISATACSTRLSRALTRLEESVRSDVHA